MTKKITTTELRSLVDDSLKERVILQAEGLCEGGIISQTQRDAFVVVDDDDASDGYFPMAFAREQQHIDLVNLVMKELHLPTTDARGHDWSKDRLYVFVMSSCFDIFHDSPVVPEPLASLRKLEVERHYKSERHHPEMEALTENGEELGPNDIAEMAVDRMCRNLQMSDDHRIDMKVMQKYLPKFHRGDVDAKLVLYSKYVEEHGGAVTRLYKKFHGIPT